MSKAFLTQVFERSFRHGSNERELYGNETMMPLLLEDLGHRYKNAKVIHTPWGKVTVIIDPAMPNDQIKLVDPHHTVVIENVKP